MRYCGMKHPRWKKVLIESEHMVLENKSDSKTRKYKWVFNGETKPLSQCTVKDKFTGKMRPFKTQPTLPVRGYRVDKPEFKDSFFLPTYSRAVDILLMGFRGKGKIEAVR